MNHAWKPIIKQLMSAGNILLTTHINPDGDGIGSEMAMYECLRKMGKPVEIINSSKLPEEYSFLDREGVIRQYNPASDKQRLTGFDLVIIFDVGGITRTGILGEDLTNLNITSICIDHHPGNHVVSDFKVVDDKAPATTCLIFDLIKAINPEYIDQNIAEAIYVGLMTDTGSFRFENTNIHAFQIAAELMAYNIKPNGIFKYVYESYSRQRMTLLGNVLQTVHYEYDGKLAWFTVSQEDLQSVGADIDEIGGFSDFIRSIKGVEVAIMFLEIETGKVRVNFRSKGKVVVNKIAEMFGGGGHFYAAGLRLDGSIKEVTSQVLPQVRLAVENLKE